MIFKVLVHSNAILFPTIGEYLVESASAEIAATFALSVAKRNFPDEDGLHVVRSAVVEGEFIGKAAEHRVQPTGGNVRQKAASKRKVATVKKVGSPTSG